MEFSTSFALAIVVALCAAGAVYFVLRARIDALSRRVAFVGTAVTACAESIAAINGGTTGGSVGGCSEAEYETDTDDDCDGGDDGLSTVRMVQLSAPSPDRWPPVQATIVEEVDERRIVSEDERRIVSEDESEDGGGHFGDTNVVVRDIATYADEGDDEDDEQEQEQEQEQDEQEQEQEQDEQEQDEQEQDEQEQDEQDAEEQEQDAEEQDAEEQDAEEQEQDAEEHDAEALRKRYGAMTKDALKRLVSDGRLVSNPSRLLKHQLVDVLVDAAERG